MVKQFYFDTYALIEISKGNPAYGPYKEEVKVMLNNLNLLEFSYFLAKTYPVITCQVCTYF